MAARRIERINAVIKQIASKAILFELKDPRIGFCTITRVETSPDLQTAKVFVSVMGSASEQKKTIAAIKHARGYIQGEVAKGLKARYSPTITIIEDPSIKASFHISELLRKDQET